MLTKNFSFVSIPFFFSLFRSVPPGLIVIAMPPNPGPWNDFGVLLPAELRFLGGLVPIDLPGLGEAKIVHGRLRSSAGKA